MTQDHRFPNTDRTKSAVVIIVQVRSADPAPQDADQGIARRGLWFGLILDPKIVGGMQPAGEVSHITYPSEKAGTC